MTEPYTIHMHRHAVACWAAGRAAAVVGCRFTVEQARMFLESAGFTDETYQDPRDLPQPDNIDFEHRRWCCQIIKTGAKAGKTITHGVAAKLVNVYLKLRMVCAGFENDTRVAVLHPPIDSVLLGELQKQNVGGFGTQWTETAWSKFDYKQYQRIINMIRQAIPGLPMWMIEQCWKGYR